MEGLIYNIFSPVSCVHYDEECDVILATLEDGVRLAAPLRQAQLRWEENKGNLSPQYISQLFASWKPFTGVKGQSWNYVFFFAIQLIMKTTINSLPPGRVYLNPSASS